MRRERETMTLRRGGGTNGPSNYVLIGWNHPFIYFWFGISESTLTKLRFKRILWSVHKSFGDLQTKYKVNCIGDNSSPQISNHILRLCFPFKYLMSNIPLSPVWHSPADLFISFAKLLSTIQHHLNHFKLVGTEYFSIDIVLPFIARAALCCLFESIKFHSLHVNSMSFCFAMFCKTHTLKGERATIEYNFSVVAICLSNVRIIVILFKNGKLAKSKRYKMDCRS